MSFDLTNKNISDTFQNLLQKTGSGNQLYDLKGNQITDLTIAGALHAQSYIISQSIVSVSSGSILIAGKWAAKPLPGLAGLVSPLVCIS